MDATQYLRDSARTASGQFHAELINPAEMDYMLRAVVAGGEWADRLKRSLFYGAAPKDTAGRWSTTSLNLNPDMTDLIHAVLGCITESAELADHLRHVLTGAGPLDAVNLKEEFGDNLWYVALGLRALKSNFEESFDTNIEKLRKRFPDKFTEEAAINRDLSAERAVLEQAEITPPARIEPTPGSVWQHSSGRQYEVLHVANEPDEPRYPLTIVYKGENGKVWARPGSDWHRSMTFVSTAPHRQAELPLISSAHGRIPLRPFSGEQPGEPQGGIA